MLINVFEGTHRCSNKFHNSYNVGNFELSFYNSQAFRIPISNYCDTKYIIKVSHYFTPTFNAAKDLKCLLSVTIVQISGVLSLDAVESPNKPLICALLM